MLPEMISRGKAPVPIAIFHMVYIHLETEAKPTVQDFGVQCDLLFPMPTSSFLPVLNSTANHEFYETDTEDEINDKYQSMVCRWIH